MTTRKFSFRQQMDISVLPGFIVSGRLYTVATLETMNGLSAILRVRGYVIGGRATGQRIKALFTIHVYDMENRIRASESVDAEGMGTTEIFGLLYNILIQTFPRLKETTWIRYLTAS